MTNVERAAKLCVKELKAMKETLSGEDSDLNNVWEEYCAQVQGEQSFYWEMYLITIDRLIAGKLEDSGININDCEEVEDFSQEVRNAIWTMAANSRWKR